MLGVAHPNEDGMTSNGVFVTVTALKKPAGQIAHVVTFAKEPEAIPTLAEAARIVGKVLKVPALVRVDPAHVTLLFTLEPVEEAAFQRRLAVLKLSRALVAAIAEECGQR